MRAIARTSAAVTFVNALPTGFGCAAAIGIPVEAEVDARPTRSATGRLEVGPASDTPLVRASLLEALRSFGGTRPVDLRLEVRSRVPWSRGLKSSSAVSTAVLLATGRALGAAPTAETAARLSAGVARETGLSATGALDDALAAAEGGIVVTDNGHDAILARAEAEPGWGVALWIPRGRHEPSPRWAEAFRARAAEGRAAADEARAGRFLAALERNTEIVESVLGLDYRGLREELRRHGALGSGVSGLGPTLAVLAPADRVSEVARALPRGRAEVVVSAFRRSERLGPTGAA